MSNLVCSARTCRETADHALAWRNPRIHTESRRKVWLACAAHVESLRSFLAARGFPVEVVGVDDLDDGGARGAQRPGGGAPVTDPGRH